MFYRKKQETEKPIPLVFKSKDQGAITIQGKEFLLDEMSGARVLQRVDKFTKTVLAYSLLQKFPEADLESVCWLIHDAIRPYVHAEARRKNVSIAESDIQKDISETLLHLKALSETNLFRASRTPWERRRDEEAEDIKVQKRIIRERIGEEVKDLKDFLAVDLERLIRKAKMTIVAGPSLPRPELEGGFEPPPKPLAQPYGVSGSGAEKYCAAWLEHLGAEVAMVSQQSHDGGWDIITQNAVFQVKAYSTTPVGVQVAREILGVAVSLGKIPAICISSSFTNDAEQFVRQTGIAVFIFKAEVGYFSPANEPAQRIIDDFGIRQAKKASSTAYVESIGLWAVESLQLIDDRREAITMLLKGYGYLEDKEIQDLRRYEAGLSLIQLFSAGMLWAGDSFGVNVQKAESAKRALDNYLGQSANIWIPIAQRLKSKVEAFPF